MVVLPTRSGGSNRVGITALDTHVRGHDVLVTAQDTTAPPPLHIPRTGGAVDVQTTARGMRPPPCHRKVPNATQCHRQRSRGANPQGDKEQDKHTKSRERTN